MIILGYYSLRILVLIKILFIGILLKFFNHTTKISYCLIYIFVIFSWIKEKKLCFLAKKEINFVLMIANIMKLILTNIMKLILTKINCFIAKNIRLTKAQRYQDAK